PGAAFRQLKEAAVLGSLLTLTFAALAVALTTRRFLLKPIQRIATTMGRAELGDFLVRAQVATEDELGRLARSFNTMLARVTDMAVKEIETRRSMEQLERELALKRELQAAHEKLAEHVRDMELLLGVSGAVTGTLELPAQLQELGTLVCPPRRRGLGPTGLGDAPPALDRPCPGECAAARPRHAHAPPRPGDPRALLHRPAHRGRQPAPALRPPGAGAFAIDALRRRGE